MKAKFISFAFLFMVLFLWTNVGRSQELPIITTASTVCACPGGTNILVPITVQNFNTVGSISLTLLFNNPNLVYKGTIFNPEFYNLGGMLPIVNAPGGNKIKVAWFTDSMLNLADGDWLFKFKFNVASSSPLTWDLVNQGFCQYSDTAGYAYDNAVWVNGSMNGEIANATITSTPTVCSGQEAQVSIDFTAGCAPFTIYYNNGVDFDTVITSADPYVFSQAITTNTTWTLTYVNSVAGCVNPSINLSTTTTLAAAPAPFNVTGGGTTCVGCTGVPIGLDGSETGMTYNLYLDNVFYGMSLEGTGDPLGFGLFDQAGTYTIKATNGNCDAWMLGEAIVENTPAIVVTLDPFAPVCEDAEPFLLTGGLPVGGTFSGLGVDENNYFHPGEVGPGEYEITYTFTDISGTGFAMQILTVYPLPEVSFLDNPTSICIDAEAFLVSVSPEGGILSGEGIDGMYFSPADAGPGTWELTYVITDDNGCTNSDVMEITVNELPEVTLAQEGPFCLLDEIVILDVSPTGGTLSGDGILNNEAFVPVEAGVGDHVITYTYVDDNACVNSASITITVFDLPQLSFNTVGPLCLNNEPVQLIGDPAEGIFSGNGVVNDNWFDPLVAGAGISPVTYTVTDANGCSNEVTQDIVVNSLTELVFMGGDPVCLDGEPINLNYFVDPVGGTFEGPGISENWFYPAEAGAGEWTLTYTFENEFGCISTAEQNIVVQAVPEVTIEEIGPFCVNAEPVMLVGNPAGGSFDGPGVMDGMFYPGQANIGVNVITYFFNDPLTNCDAYTSIEVVVNALPEVGITPIGPFCVNSDAVEIEFYPLDGTLSGEGLEGNYFVPAIGPGTWPILLEYTDENACYNSASIEVTVNYLPLINALSLDVSTDAMNWSAVNGDLAAGFTLCLDPTVDFNYFDINTLSGPVNPLLSTTFEQNAFYLDETAVPAGFFDYWAAKGVIAGAAGWQGVMWDIINGAAPMLFIKYNGGIDYELVDGLQYLASGGLTVNPLRVSGDYPQGTYTFSGTVTDVSGCVSSPFAVQILFNSAPVVNSVSLNASTDGIDWSAVNGNLATGYNLCLYPVNDYTYFDVNTLSGPVNPLLSADFVQNAFYLDETNVPAGFFDYWAAKGVIAGAAGWQGVMWDIINGTAPMLYIKYNGGDDYELVDGLQYLASGGLTVNPLRVSGDYPLGNYTFSGTVTDVNGCVSSPFDVQILFNGAEVVTFNPLPGVCINSEPLELTAEPMGGVFSGAGVEGNTFDPSVAGLGSWEITYTVQNAETGCIGSASQTITVSSTPEVIFDELEDVCINGGPVQLSATPEGGYFEGPGVVGNVFHPEIAGIGISTLTYNYSAGNDCFGSASQEITVFDLPVITFDPLAPLCLSATPVELIAYPEGGTFSGDAVINNTLDPILTGFGPGSYAITYSYADENGCSASATQVVTVYDNPMAELSGNAAICTGESTMLTVNVLSGTPPFVAEFSDGQTFAFSDMTYQFFVTPTETTTYTLSSITDGNGCFTELNSSVTVEVNPLPEVFNVGGGGAYCAGGNGVDITLDGSEPDVAYFLYFEGQVAATAVGTGEPLVFNNAVEPGIYSIMATTENACSSTMEGSAEVMLSPALAVNAGPDITIPVGGSANLSVSIEGGTEPFTYAWTPVDFLDDPTLATPVSTTTATITYTVLVTDALGCSGTDDVTVNVIEAYDYIQGVISYQNDGATPMSNVMVTLVDLNGINPNQVTTTDNNGAYAFTDLANSTYQLIAETDKAWGGGNAADGLIMLKNFAGQWPLEGIKLLAGDVSGNNKINALDALNTLRRFVGYLENFLPVPDWFFEQPVVELDGITEAIINFQGICAGDVNGDYLPPTIKPQPTVFVNQEGFIYTNPLGTIDLPVIAEDNMTIGALSLIMNIPDGVEVQSVKLNADASNLLYKVNGKQLRIGWFNLEPVTMGAGETLFTLSVNTQKTEEMSFSFDGASIVSDANASTIQNARFRIPKLAAPAQGAGLNIYPNPVNSNAQLQFTMPLGGKVELVLYNCLGEKISTLLSETRDAGTYNLDLDASSLASGVYYCKLTVDNQNELTQMISVTR